MAGNTFIKKFKLKLALDCRFQLMLSSSFVNLKGRKNDYTEEEKTFVVSEIIDKKINCWAEEAKNEKEN